MATKIILNINEKLAEKAKKYADAQGQSLSSLVESLFSEIPENEVAISKKPQIKDPELVRKILEGTEPVPAGLKKLQGILKGMTDEEVENAKWEYLKQKYDL